MNVITTYPSCPYECRYCWANEPLWRYRLRNPKPIEKALKFANAGKPRTIMVSYTTEPYQPVEEKKRITRKVLEILAPTQHCIMVLTKNPALAVKRDMDLLTHPNVLLGTTLTALKKIDDEPFAPPNDERVSALKSAYKNGVCTWALIEPWIPDVTFPDEIISETHRFIDFYVIGKLNYETRHGYPKVPTTFYCERLPRIIKLLAELKKPFVLKEKLEKTCADCRSPKGCSYESV